MPKNKKNKVEKVILEILRDLVEDIDNTCLPLNINLSVEDALLEGYVREILDNCK